MTILVPIDDREFGKLILETISLMPQARHESRLLFVHAVEPSDLEDYITSVYGYSPERQYLQERIAHAEELLREMKEYAKKLGIDSPISTAVELGRPKEVILDAAAHNNADLIIVGSHGRRGVTRFLLGSVSLSILSQAPCSVLIVKKPCAPKAKRQAVKEAAAQH